MRPLRCLFGFHVWLPVTHKFVRFEDTRELIHVRHICGRCGHRKSYLSWRMYTI